MIFFSHRQDFEILRRVAGCRDHMTQENFERMWRWLYPVAFALSRSVLREMWSSKSPTWIEGFITKEEAEASLQGPGGSQEPGTFILRFPTSRSWPHPDAGSLVVTYVGSNYSLHHRLLSLDHMYESAQSIFFSLSQVFELHGQEIFFCKLTQTLLHCLCLWQYCSWRKEHDTTTRDAISRA